MFGKKKPLSAIEKKAKLAVLKDAHGMASDSLKGQLSGLKKVEVMSNNKNGLQHGLAKAKELISGSKMSEDGDDADSRVNSGKERKHYMDDDTESMHGDFTGHDDSETESEDDSSSEDSEPSSVQEIEDKIAELMKMKEHMSSKRNNPFA